MEVKLDNTEKSLSQMFEEGYQLYNDILNSDLQTNSDEIQVKIRRAMRLLEDTTRLVSLTSLFSSNESIDEVATSNLKYFLLPLLLGNLSQKLSVKDRMEVVKTADIYFRDFLKRCKAYGITSVEVPQLRENEENTICSTQQTPGQSLVQSVCNRASKIQKYNEQKSLEAELKIMKQSLTADVDDEYKRKYYLNLIKYNINEALNEIDSLQSEKEIIKYMAKIKPIGSLNAKETQEKMPKTSRSLQPIIITKDEVQKKVFGAGYPSLPTLTVKEFYDQRVKDGIFPDAETSKAHSLQALAGVHNAEKMEDIEAEQREQRIEEDDEEMLAQARAMDDYKDVHKRGWGNRYNRS